MKRSILLSAVVTMLFTLAAASYAQLTVKNNAEDTVMQVTSDGEVGIAIGDATPAATLDVGGDLRLGTVVDEGNSDAISVLVLDGGLVKKRTLTADIWDGDDAGTDADAIIGNEIVSAGNNSLTRTGQGTSSSPFQLQINQSTTDGWYVNEGQANSISSGMITDGEVGTADLANGAVNSAKVENNSLSASDLSVDVVSSIDGIDNDGGNIDLQAGGIVNISSNNSTNTISISAQDQTALYLEEKVFWHQQGWLDVSTTDRIDIPNCSVTVPSAGRYLITATADIEAKNTNAAGLLDINGTIIGGHIIVGTSSDADNIRSSGSRTWVKDLNAGDVIKLKGTSTGTGTAKVWRSHTNLVVMALN
jgi:hypothetical protein